MTVYKHPLAVFVSGRGSNLHSLIENCQQADFPARITLVVSNRPDAPALTLAEQAGITPAVVPHDDYPDRTSHGQALMATLHYHSTDIDMICLAGYDRLLAGDFIRNVGIDIINIHPSLLPKHKGLNPNARVLASGDNESGCTVHRVIEDMDAGEIILQKRVPVHRDDTPETLAARVLEQEHLAYPQALRKIFSQRQKRVA
ncbi:MAG: phosphoribosylglycinamide formyltransferase [Alphaproteobacteria bacterium GM202ARS2]|nr:phosphoribosylglycinamide formyltransferase [Alphaproteobacteria bacterium GM202ARS2]